MLAIFAHEKCHLTMMKAAVFKRPYLVQTIEKEKPALINPTDVLVKVRFSGLCGSDLHYYRGHIPSKPDNTMGHEFLGTVVETGSGIHAEDFSIGDDVIATFTIQCGECWYCTHGYSGTCDRTNTFGKPGLQGGQAEFVLVPFANSTLVKKPKSDENFDESVYVLMADIFVTAYYGVKKIMDHFTTDVDVSTISVLQIGAGPVGLCAVRILRHFGFEIIVVVDGIEDRLNHAKSLGASATVNYVHELSKLDILKRTLTGDRGFDAALEIVGTGSALKTAFETVRRGGFISSVGMGHEPLPFDALEAYVKCVTISFGRCNAWSLFKEALRVFESLKSDLTDLIDVKCHISEAEEYYSKFERGEVKKVVFVFS
ncbi:hypothetical protein OXX59_002973 [Metschnikowia pulcherrima]